MLSALTDALLPLDRAAFLSHVQADLLVLADAVLIAGCQVNETNARQSLRLLASLAQLQPTCFDAAFARLLAFANHHPGSPVRVDAVAAAFDAANAQPAGAAITSQLRTLVERSLASLEAAHPGSAESAAAARGLASLTAVHGAALDALPLAPHALRQRVCRRLQLLRASLPAGAALEACGELLAPSEPVSASLCEHAPTASDEGIEFLC